MKWGRGYLFSGGHWRMLGGKGAKNKNSKRIPAGWRAWTFFFHAEWPEGTDFCNGTNGTWKAQSTGPRNVHRNFKRITPLSLGNKIIPSARTLLNKTTLKRENLERRKCIFPPRATFILLLASFLNKVPDCYLRCLVSWIPESILNLLTVIGIACQVRTPGWERRPSKLTGISSTVDFDPDGQWRTVSLPFFPLAGRWRPFHQSDSLPFL